jgi:hypothetical protein
LARIVVATFPRRRRPIGSLAPVNFWAGALLFTVAVDLTASHTRR